MPTAATADADSTGAGTAEVVVRVVVGCVQPVPTRAGGNPVVDALLREHRIVGPLLSQPLQELL